MVQWGDHEIDKYSRIEMKISLMKSKRYNITDELMDPISTNRLSIEYLEKYL